LRSVAVQDLVVSALGLLEATLAAADANIQVVRLSTGTIPMVLGNFTQLEQALLQVLTNAVAACCAASQPNDSAPATDGSQPASPRRKGRILVQTQCVERRAVSIAVSDDGIGIRETELENVFEPFVALRADSGPGLGLTIARRIIEEHGGKIWAESNEATGTTVCIQLPTAEGSAA
jgi:signal transduction histidine kinase